MKIKVSATTPAQLNWLVAKCEGFKGDEINHPLLDGFLPSTNPAQGQPILEREYISVVCARADGVWCAYACNQTPEASIAARGLGPTMLCAGMRCYVINKLGDEVEIPEELL